MKILHTSDWHLGKRLEGFSRLEEQEAVLGEICEIAEKEQVDAVIVAGDLFDTYNPPTEAVELFYRCLKKLARNGSRAVIAIAGNHDSPERIEAPDPLARECGIIFAGNPNSAVAPFRLETGLEVTKSDTGFIEVMLPGISCPLRILLAPYANELRLKTFLGVEDSDAELRKLFEQRWSGLSSKYCDNRGVNILAAHLLFASGPESIPEEPEEERRINYIGGAPPIFTENISGEVQYVALGHLHRKQVIGTLPCPMVYSGSPIAYSFGEANQEKYVVIVEAEPGLPVTTRDIILNSGKQLLRNRFEDIDEAVGWLNLNPNAFVELTIVSDQYLATADRKRLLEAHPGIVTIIPESRGQGMDDTTSITAADLTKSMEDLFTDFFIHRKGQEPNERILDLFREAISTEEAP
ncbi:MAG: exonuclease subunit SbcD [Bacteroidetes bacterium]|nr:exonuclease subunit SbcD [Bacteroidota bacterium]